MNKIFNLITNSFTSLFKFANIIKNYLKQINAFLIHYEGLFSSNNKTNCYFFLAVSLVDLNE